MERSRCGCRSLARLAPSAGGPLRTQRTRRLVDRPGATESRRSRDRCGRGGGGRDEREVAGLFGRRRIGTKSGSGEHRRFPQERCGLWLVATAAILADRGRRQNAQPHTLPTQIPARRPRPKLPRFLLRPFGSTSIEQCTGARMTGLITLRRTLAGRLASLPGGSDSRGRLPSREIPVIRRCSRRGQG